MSANIVANVTRMFASIEPCYVSASRAELGDSAGSITWRNALEIARNRGEWLKSGESEACEGMRGWARETGAWDRDEIASWSDDECIAIFVQNLAGELRMMRADDSDRDMSDCVRTYSETEWDREPGYPVGHYWIGNNSVMVEYYTGI